MTRLFPFFIRDASKNCYIKRKYEGEEEKVIKRLIVTGLDFAGYMRKKNISSFAASTAFFLFLSLVPMMLLLCALIPYTPLTEAGLMSVVTGIVPDSMDAMVIRLIADVYDKSIGVISVTAIVTLWSAGKGILALMRGLNAVYHVEENRNYVVLRMIASFYTILMLILMLLSLIFLVFGNVWVEILKSRIPQTAYLFDFLFRCRGFFIWLFITAVIALIYTFVPGKKLRLKGQLAGAAGAAACWNGITWAFSVYIDSFNGFNMYGRLAAVSVLLLWLYSCMYIVLAGAAFNRYFKSSLRFVMGKT